MKVFDLVKGFCFLSWEIVKIWVDQIIDDSLRVNSSKVCNFVDSLSFRFFSFFRQLNFRIDLQWIFFFFLYCQSKHPTDLRFHDSRPLTYLLLNVKFLKRKLNSIKN